MLVILKCSNTSNPTYKTLQKDRQRWLIHFKVFTEKKKKKIQSLIKFDYLVHFFLKQPIKLLLQYYMKMILAL